MALDLSNEYVAGAVAVVALFLPHFALINAYQVARYPRNRTPRRYWTTGLLLLGSALFYAFALDNGSRIIFGGGSLMLLAMRVAVQFFFNR